MGGLKSPKERGRLQKYVWSHTHVVVMNIGVDGANRDASCVKGQSAPHFYIVPYSPDKQAILCRVGAVSTLKTTSSGM